LIRITSRVDLAVKSTEPSYKWFFKNETIANGNALIINKAMERKDNGTYTCLAYNKHGTSIAETVIEVQCKYKGCERYTSILYFSIISLFNS